MEELYETNKCLLKSTLLDEGNVITYLSISKDLCIHVNISKKILQRLVEHVREENPNLKLNVCYIVSGTIENNNGRTIVCAEPDLFEEKKGFNNIFFEHIYSVAKGSPSIDVAAYLAVNKFEDFVLCSGLIKNKLCDKRTLDEIGELKSNSQDKIVPVEKNKPLPILSKKIKQEVNTTKNVNNEITLLSKKDIETKSEPVLKQELISPKKETIGNNKSKSNSIISQKSQKGIAGFFSKTNNTITKKEVKEKLQNEETKQDIKINNKKYEEMEVEETPTKKDIVKVENGKENSNKILNKIKKTSKVEKKRKRVLHVSDSESDNENNEPFVNECDEKQNQIVDDSEDEIPPTPTVTNIVIKSGIVNPKKRRKIVDKTYTDEDGYILTKKVEVYESCSENEEEVKVQEKPQQVKEVKKEISPKGKTTGSKKKVSPPNKGKQPTLTNFFKKV